MFIVSKEKGFNSLNSVTPRYAKVLSGFILPIDILHALLLHFNGLCNMIFSSAGFVSVSGL